MTITENGYGKRCDFEEFRLMKNRGGHGVACHNISEKTGALAAVASVEESDDIMLITSDGVIIRTPCDGIPSYSRTAGGVIVMRLSEGVKVVTFTRLESEEAIEEEIAEAPADEAPTATDTEEKTADTDGDDTADSDTEEGEV